MASVLGFVVFCHSRFGRADPRMATFGLIVWVALQLRRAAIERLTQSPLAFLYSSFESRAWWFEGVILTRRILIALITSVVPPSSLLVAPLLAAIVLVPWQLAFRP